ncbi:hypothetical protein [Streptosporangium sp. NPDC051022]|uniref:hypothetical protein n=1 Tax=Streptosporangium sp. NPDC051022 TaxID=3155752 RepID=UPI003425E99A
MRRSRGTLHDLPRQFGDRVAPVTSEAAEERGRPNAVRPPPPTAGVNGWTPVSRNAKGNTKDSTKDSDGTGVSAVGPFGATA